MNNSIEKDNHTMLKKLIDISLGKRGNIANPQLPRLAISRNGKVVLT